MSGRALGEKKSFLQYLQSVYATTDSTDALQLNIVRAHLQMNVLQWEAEYMELVRQYVKPERELRRRLTTTHLRKILSTGDTTGFAHTQMTNVDLRTKRATESVDLPLLDVGLDGYPEDVDVGLNGMTYCISNSNTSNTALSQQPRLGESPTSISPWLEEERRLDYILEQMDADYLQQQGMLSNSTPSSMLQQFTPIEYDDKSTNILDSDVARRLSLELMHTSSDRDSDAMMDEDSIRTKAISKAKTRSTSNNHRYKAISYRQLNAHILSEATILRSKSSPSSPSTVLDQHLSRIPQRTSAERRKQNLDSTSSSRQSSHGNRKRRIATKSSAAVPVDSNHNDDETSPGKKDIPLNGYRYGYKGSTERLQQTSGTYVRPRASASASRIYAHHQHHHQVPGGDINNFDKITQASDQYQLYITTTSWEIDHDL
ncbi:uncharacterized protein BX664DRAFT_53254 [Halteromyces radiatus]|uniref:uncharacterized protein n=1 Tax=Halteromyces radiatus TaxID=101107 RepID=UPI00221F4EFD|nr:uncharacterized protein BX664DRAFT_53254 [Halteromyces radiatus]KAI8075977.1 hypothetical protein BX664DRAFT_53254 [Halteromyces radiatus]